MRCVAGERGGRVEKGVNFFMNEGPLDGDHVFRIQTTEIEVPRVANLYLTTYIIGDVVIKLLRDEVIQTQNPYAILIPY